MDIREILEESSVPESTKDKFYENGIAIMAISKVFDVSSNGLHNSTMAMLGSKMSNSHGDLHPKWVRLHELYVEATEVSKELLIEVADRTASLPDSITDQ